MSNRMSKRLFWLLVMLPLALLSAFAPRLFPNLAWVSFVSTLPLILAWAVVVYRWMQRKRIVVVVVLLFLVGGLLNTACSLVNGGRFPVSGYSLTEWADIVGDVKVYYFPADETTSLAVLGDHKRLGSASIGDLVVFMGCVLLLWVMLAQNLIPDVCSWLQRRRGKEVKSDG